jgi:hypothetical protein
MSASENFPSDKQPTFSLKAKLMTAVIIVFGILHIAGAVMLQNAAASRSPDTSRVVTSGD